MINKEVLKITWVLITKICFQIWHSNNKFKCMKINSMDRKLMNLIASSMILELSGLLEIWKDRILHQKLPWMVIRVAISLSNKFNYKTRCLPKEILKTNFKIFSTETWIKQINMPNKTIDKDQAQEWSYPIHWWHNLIKTKLVVDSDIQVKLQQLNNQPLTKYPKTNLWHLIREDNLKSKKNKLKVLKVLWVWKID
jgi:hypothetical protein